MPRLIDADALEKDLGELRCGNGNAQPILTRAGMEIYDAAIDAAISILHDAEPVVRCKECIHRGFDDCPMCHDEYSYDEDDGANYWTVDNTFDDGFCHKGAKMDGGAEE